MTLAERTVTEEAAGEGGPGPEGAPAPDGGPVPAEGPAAPPATGERLDLIAARYYGEPSLWRVLAAYNGITGSTRIPPPRRSPRAATRHPPAAVMSLSLAQPPQVQLEADGTALPERTAAALVSVRVRQVLSEPALCELEFADCRTARRGRPARAGHRSHGPAPGTSDAPVRGRRDGRRAHVGAGPRSLGPGPRL